MVDFRKRPFHEGMERNRIARKRRAAALDYASRYATVATQVSPDESDLAAEGFPTNFSKGLLQDRKSVV